MKKDINTKEIINKLIKEDSISLVESVKDTYALNDQELIEFFVDILLIEIDNKKTYVQEKFPNHIYKLLDIINKQAKDVFPRYKNNPFFEKYNLAREKIYIIDKMYKTKQIEKVNELDANNLLKEIFHNKDIIAVKKMIMNNPLILFNEVKNRKIIEYIFNEYFISELSDKLDDCYYYNKLLTNIINTLREIDIYPNNIKKFVKSVQGIEIINDENVDTGILKLIDDFGVVSTKSHGEVFIPKKYITKPIDNVEVTIEIINSKNKMVGKIIKYQDKSVKKIGKIIKHNGKQYILVNNEVYPYNSKKYKVNDNVLVNILNDYEEIQVIKDVKIKNDIELKINQFIISNNIETEFSKESLYQAKMLSKLEKTEEENRIDLTNNKIFTIDGADTKDIDDAVSIKLLEDNTYLLSVHIADVTHYIKEFSPLDEDAKNRGNSTYLHNLVIPMLPEVLSNNLCSLTPNEERLTMTVDMNINKKGEVIKTTIYPSKIMSNKKMTYENVNKIFNNEEVRGYKKYKEDLYLMNELSMILEAKSLVDGRIQMTSEEIKFKYDKDGYPVEVIKCERQTAEDIIKNFMIITNEEVAKYISSNKLPTPYRVHKGVSKDVLDKAITNIKSLGYNFDIPKFNDNYNAKTISQLLLNVVDTEHEELVSSELSKAFSKAFYTLEELGHFALNSKKYLHFTSPIRRYSDIIAHRQVKEICNQKENDKTNYILMDSYESDLKKCSDREIKSSNCERSSEKLYACYYMSNFIDEEMTGKIIELNKNGIKVKFENGITTRITNLELSDYYYDPIENKYISYNGDTLNFGSVKTYTINSVNINELKIICSPVKVLINK